MVKLLLIQPDDERRQTLRATLEGGGFAVDAVAQPEERWDISSYEAIVADARAVDRADLLERLARAPLVLTAAGGSIAHAVRAVKRGAADYLPMPFAPHELLAAVEGALANASGSASVPDDPSRPVPMIGRSRAMCELAELIAKAAPTDCTVLIEGETGTGKELVARALHEASKRRHAPLVILNCATVPAHLIEAELFGDDPVAGSRRKGLLHAARGGTLFLDEIGELPMEAQASLLPLVSAGGTRSADAPQQHASDVRLIVASHRDLARLTERGEFRGDLYYRLNVVRLRLPPLRERSDDIAELADHMLERAIRKLSRPTLTLSAGARSAMRRYPWPGNVRELENAIERAAILCDGQEIDTPLLAIETEPLRESPDIAVDDAENTTLENYFVHFVLEHEDHLTETEIAEKLGISRKSLWERRQRLSIPRRKTRQRGPRRPTT